MEQVWRARHGHARTCVCARACMRVRGHGEGRAWLVRVRSRLGEGLSGGHSAWSRTTHRRCLQGATPSSSGVPSVLSGTGGPGMKATAGAQGAEAGLPAPRREGPPPPPTEGSPPAGRERPSVTAAEGEGEAAWSHLVLPVYRRETCGLVTLNARRPNCSLGARNPGPRTLGPRVSVPCPSRLPRWDRAHRLPPGAASARSPMKERKEAAPELPLP